MAARSATAWHTRLLQAEEALARAREAIGKGAPPDEALADALRQIDRAKLDMHAADQIGDTFGQLDQLVWNAWNKKIAPDSALAREGNFAQSLARVLSEGDDQSRARALDEVERSLASSRRIMAALIAAIAQASERFASRHVMRYGVDTIERVAQAENGRTNARVSNPDAAAWRKYKELMGETAGAAEANIEAEILRAVAEFTESLAGTFASAERDNLSQSQLQSKVQGQVPGQVQGPRDAGGSQ